MFSATRWRDGDKEARRKSSTETTGMGSVSTYTFSRHRNEVLVYGTVDHRVTTKRALSVPGGIGGKNRLSLSVQQIEVLLDISAYDTFLR